MEKWKKIKGYNNYFVSNTGKIKNINPGWRYNAKQKNGIMTPQKDSYGYFQVCLYKNGKRKLFLVHRLVAIAFISNPLNLPEVNHKNLNKIDNRVENLEWCTRKENIQHAYANGIKFGCFQKNHKLTRGSKNGNVKLNEDQVLEIRKLYASGNYIQEELGKMFGIGHTETGDIINNKKWKYV